MSVADPILAGLTAWFIELCVVLIMLYGLRREEQKVYARRKNESHFHQGG